MKKHIILALAAAMLGYGVSEARQLSVEEAVEAAMSAPSMRAPAQGGYSLSYKVEESGLNTVYVVDTPSGGYMVLAADDVCVPVLGVSDRPFDADNIPNNMRVWLDGYSRVIARAAETGGRVVSAPADPALADIAPIVKTRWDQGEPFNDMCPQMDGVTTYTGCVATAVAQVINVRKYPARGTGSHSYDWNGGTLSLDFSQIEFDWDNMFDKYDGKQTAEQKHAVAQLMYAVGVASDMNYGTQYSGAYSDAAARGLINNFGYDRGLHILFRDFIALPQWSRMLHAELSQGHAVFYDGNTATTSIGHAFVVDGYRSSDGFFHVNWGWGGVSDGYFSIVALDPAMQGVGGANEGFSSNQSAMFGMRPAQAGSSYVPVFVVESGLSTKAPSYTRSEAVEFMGGEHEGIFNLSLVEMAVDMGLCLTASDGTKSYVWWPREPYSIPDYKGILGFELAAADFPAEGTYTATIAVRYDGNIYNVYYAVGAVSEMKVTCTPERISFEPCVQKSTLKLESAEVLTPFYRGKVFEMETTVSNSGAEYFDDIRARLVKNTRSEMIGSARVDIADGGSYTVKISGTVPKLFPNGDAAVEILDREGNVLGSVDVTVSAAPSGMPVAEIRNIDFPGATVREGVAEFNGYDFAADFTLFGKQGYFSEYLVLWLTRVDGSSRQYFIAGNPLLGEGMTKTISFKENIEGLVEQGALYNVRLLSYSGDSEVEGNTKPKVRFGVNGGIIAPSGEGFGIDRGSVTAPAGITSLELYNIAGVRVAYYRFSGENNTENYDAGLSRGHYVARIMCADGRSAVLKLAR